MKYHLPIRVERTVRDAHIARTELATQCERELRSMEDAALTCEKGCHHCCHHPIIISLLEGITIFRWLAENELWTKALRTRFEGVSQQTLGLPIVVWLLSMIPCPLLSDKGLCQAYDARPFICRVTVSVRDPYFCHPHRLSEDTGLVPRSMAIDRLEAAEKPLRKRHAAGGLMLPFAQAVLYGEKICTGDLEFEDVALKLWAELRDDG